MSLFVHKVTLTTNAQGGGTATTPAPVNGFVHAIRCAGSWGGTSDLLFRSAAEEGAGTIFSLPNASAPFFANVGGSIEGGGPSSFTSGLPCDGYLELVVAEGSGATSGTVYIYTDSER